MAPKLEPPIVSNALSISSMKFTRDQWKLHSAAAIPALLMASGCIGWYVIESIRYGQWLGGGSAPGLLCGCAAGLIILFEMVLWPRKFWRKLRLLPARYWMAGHLWFGFVCLPIAIFHSGFHFGGIFANVLMVALILTYFSGVYGLIVQNLLPRWMLRNLSAETIYSQIDHVSEVLADDARKLLLAAVGASPFESIAVENKDPSPVAVVASTKKKGAVQGRMVNVTNIQSVPEDARVLWTAYQEIEPFLRHGKKTGGPLADPLTAERWFDTLARSCDERNSDIVSKLREFFHQRRQFDVQQTVHRWLHYWLPLHVGLSVLVSVLLAAHVFLALKYL